MEKQKYQTDRLRRFLLKENHFGDLNFNALFKNLILILIISPLISSLSVLGTEADSIADLRTMQPVNGARIYLKCHTIEGKGSGWFRGVTGASIGTYTDDNGVTIVPTGGDGSGAFLRDYNGAVNIKWFGAIDDGNTDTTEEIQDAINYALPLGKAVDFAGGTYLISEPLLIPANNVEPAFAKYIHGNGAKILATFDDFIFSTANSLPAYWIHFDGFNFESVVDSGTKGFDLCLFVRIVVENCLFKGVDYPFQARSGLPTAYSQSARIIRNKSYWHKAFFDASRVFDVDIIGNSIEAAQGDGIVIGRPDDGGQSAYGLRIHSNTIESNKYDAIKLKGGNGISIVGNYFENNGNDINLSASSVWFAGLTINYNFFQEGQYANPEGRASILWGATTTAGAVATGNISISQNVHDFSAYTSNINGYINICGNADVNIDPYSASAPTRARVISSKTPRFGVQYDYAVTMFNPTQLGIEIGDTQNYATDSTNNELVPILIGVARKYPATSEGTCYPPSAFSGIYNYRYWARGSHLVNATPVVTGAEGNKYIIKGWTCTASGSPGTWVECRTLTGD